MTGRLLSATVMTMNRQEEAIEAFVLENDAVIE
jgi:hypothetical protein